MNWAKDGNGDGNEDEIREDGEEANKRKKSLKPCRRDQPFSLRTRHHLYRQGVAFAGTRQLRSHSPVSIHVYRTEGVTGSDGRRETNEVMGGIRVGGGCEDWNGVGGENGHVNVDRGRSRNENWGGGQ